MRQAQGLGSLLALTASVSSLFTMAKKLIPTVIDSKFNTIRTFKIIEKKVKIVMALFKYELHVNSEKKTNVSYCNEIHRTITSDIQKHKMAVELEATQHTDCRQYYAVMRSKT